MDEINEVAQRIENLRPESSLTIKWAAIFTMMGTIIAFLVVGYFTNATNITKIQTQVSYLIDGQKEFGASQKRVEDLVTEIRIDQRRREAREK